MHSKETGIIMLLFHFLCCTPGFHSARDEESESCAIQRPRHPVVVVLENVVDA